MGYDNTNFATMINLNIFPRFLQFSIPFIIAFQEDCHPSYVLYNATFQAANNFKHEQRRWQQRRRSPVSVSSFTLAAASTFDATSVSTGVSNNVDTVNLFINMLEKEKKIDEAAALWEWLSIHFPPIQVFLQVRMDMTSCHFSPSVPMPRPRIPYG